MMAWPYDNGTGHLPDLIRVEQHLGDPHLWKLLIDGHPFPYHVAPSPRLTPLGWRATPGISVDLLADVVQVDNDPRLSQEIDGKVQHVESPSRWDVPIDPRFTTPADPARWSGSKVPRLAGLIQVRRIGTGRSWWELVIDGEAFPYRLAAHCNIPVTIMSEPEFMPRVNVTLLARRVEVDVEGPIGGDGSALAAATAELGDASQAMSRAQENLEDARLSAAFHLEGRNKS
jgi:hypothetical protein